MTQNERIEKLEKSEGRLRTTVIALMSLIILAITVGAILQVSGIVQTRIDYLTAAQNERQDIDDDKAYTALNVPGEIILLFNNNNRAWSDGDVDKLVENVYSIPLHIYMADDVIVLNTEEELRQWLQDTFSQLEAEGYSHSIFNRWEHLKFTAGNCWQ